VIIQSVLIFLSLLSWQAAAPAPQPTPEAPVQLAPGVSFIRSVAVQGRGPDGNTVIFEAPDGLVVVDTGRHAYHSDAILAFAKAKQRPIVAIINTHWHLDHSTGNARLKAAFPNARVYTSTAIDRAVAPGGFLSRNLADAEKMAGQTDLPPVTKEEIQIFLTTMQSKETLRADVPLTTSGTMTIGGRAFDVHVADDAVTDADVWLYDPGSKIAVIGDIVTVPVPYFETACPDGWKNAMDAVWATAFDTAIPGHGKPMTRADFDVYRKGFAPFVDCVRSSAEAGTCSAAWVTATSSLIGEDPARRKAVADNMNYYVSYLRKTGGKAADCRAK
jgi:glyoxylase-like metal-dependent hydrolase (beta-lactamase superfamily II)